MASLTKAFNQPLKFHERAGQVRLREDTSFLFPSSLALGLQLGDSVANNFVQDLDGISVRGLGSQFDIKGRHRSAPICLTVFCDLANSFGGKHWVPCRRIEVFRFGDSLAPKMLCVLGIKVQ